MAAQPEPRAPVVHQVPGIIYSPLSGRAHILGSGLEVFEIIVPYRAVDEDFEKLREWFHWLSEDQLRAAITFWKANPDIVNPRVEREENLDLEEVWRQYPFMRPRDR